MPRDGPPQRFLDELGAAFRRLELHGRPSWGFTSAYGRLERVVHRGVRLAGSGLDQPADGRAGPRSPGSPLPGGLGARAARVARVAAALGATRSEGAVRRALQTAVAPALTATDEGLAAVLEVVRFLAARVELLEGVEARRHHPVEGTAWLTPPPDLEQWAGTVDGWLGPGRDDASGERRIERRIEAEVLVGECGDGALAGALAASGRRVRAAEPRGEVAAAAAGRGVDVHVGPMAELVSLAAPGSAAGIVLAGVVDRAPVDELVELVALAVDRLATGAALVVISAGVDGWDDAALDLLPGRPLRAATWELLLRRAGCTATETVRHEAAYAVMGRR
jgi:hypothetical protein